MNSRHTRLERGLRKQGFSLVAGVDEAGRGPLAGPVVAAAVIMPEGLVLSGVDDSKLLSSEEREDLFEKVRESAIGFGIGIVNHDTIDRVNILQASFLAMETAIACIQPLPDHLLIDGNRFCLQETSQVHSIPYTLVVDGDARCYSIAAASILAKVTRDRIMVSYEEQYPGYGFARHKGYSTPEHREAIFRLGYCEIHRRSFTVREQLELTFPEPAIHS
jgi:ribonuclease HII